MRFFLAATIATCLALDLQPGVKCPEIASFYNDDSSGTSCCTDSTHEIDERYLPSWSTRLPLMEPIYPAFVRWGPNGKAGMLWKGVVRDLSSMFPTVTNSHLTVISNYLRDTPIVTLTSTHLVVANAAITHMPVPEPGNVPALSGIFLSHTAAANGGVGTNSAVTAPTVFFKGRCAVVPSTHAIVPPPLALNSTSGRYDHPYFTILGKQFSSHEAKDTGHFLDWEVEIGIVIGQNIYNADLTSAKNAIAGLVTISDMSERSIQFGINADGQWGQAKAACSSGTISSAMIPYTEAAYNEIKLFSFLDGTRKQNDDMKLLKMRPEQIVQYISQRMELRPGDIISSGTPGNQMAYVSGEYLTSNNLMTHGATGIGSFTQGFVSFAHSGLRTMTPIVDCEICPHPAKAVWKLGGKEASSIDAYMPPAVMKSAYSITFDSELKLPPNGNKPPQTLVDDAIAIQGPKSSLASKISDSFFGTNYPSGGNVVDVEPVIAIRMKSDAYGVSVASIRDFVDCVTIGLDVTERGWQYAYDANAQWDIAKSAPTFTPLSKQCVTPANLSSTTRVSVAINGNETESWTVAELFKTPMELVSHMTQLTRLHAGDYVLLAPINKGLNTATVLTQPGATVTISSNINGVSSKSLSVVAS